MTSKKSHQYPVVWLILTKVEAVADNPGNLTTGSEALVQCFVPERNLDTAVVHLDNLLGQEGMRRKDILSETRYEMAEDFDDNTPDFVKRDVLETAKTGKPMTGTFFISKESASVQSPDGLRT